MSAGTLYVNNSPRATVTKALIQYLNLDVKIVNVNDDQENFAKHFPLKKCPAFLGPKNFALPETIAIVYHCMLY